MALSSRLDRAQAAPPETRQRALVLSVRAFIEQRLDDPGLSPATIAAAHHVSLRALHKLFEGERTTVAALIRERRLEQIGATCSIPRCGRSRSARSRPAGA